ncbi:hypothetical protein Tco_0693210 [Tanacetum coccineum]
MEKLRHELWKYSWVTRMEFPTFKGDDVRGWLYKCEQFFRINDVPGEHKVLVEYSDAFKSLFNIVSLLSDMGEDETHFVDLFIKGLHPGIGSVVRRFLDKVSKARDESNGFESKKSSEVDDVVGNKDEGRKECELLASSCDLDGFDDILGEVTVRGLKVKNKSLFLPDSSLNNSREVINESCKENGNTCGDGIKVNLRKNRTLDGVVMDGEPVFVKVDKECFIEMALDPQGRMQPVREKDDLEPEY